MYLVVKPEVADCIRERLPLTFMVNGTMANGTMVNGTAEVQERNIEKNEA